MLLILPNKFFLAAKREVTRVKPLMRRGGGGRMENMTSNEAASKTAAPKTGHLLAVGTKKGLWLGTSADHRLHGGTVHDILRRSLPARLVHRRAVVTPGYVIECWRAR